MGTAYVPIAEILDEQMIFNRGSFGLSMLHGPVQEQ